MQSALCSISPLDGRYARQTEVLQLYFSEGALIKYRVYIEIEYFIVLCDLLPRLKGIEKSRLEELRRVYKDFSTQDAVRVKEIEKQLNHDVKAIEYFLREKFDQMGWDEHKEWIHFGLTSQDINNTAVPCSLRDAWQEVLQPLIEKVIAVIEQRAADWKKIPMLARTHGQPASPTRLGKEIYVFADRLKRQFRQIQELSFCAKFGGATGNFNAHYAAYPEIDWFKTADHLVGNVLGLERCQVTTQIEHYDNMAAFFDNIKRINTIMIDLNQDIWTYISMNYFKQKIKPGEVGSSAMPHKVNPIDFENSEGNLGLANALLTHLGAKLPVSRLQRDLTDSTVSRNIGVPLAHTLIALGAFLKGFDKLVLNPSALSADLENNWAVVAEAIQTILRREGHSNPYETIKDLTRTHGRIDKTVIRNFINGLDVSNALKKELLYWTPENYIGGTCF